MKNTEYWWFIIIYGFAMFGCGWSACQTLIEETHNSRAHSTYREADTNQKNFLVNHLM